MFFKLVLLYAFHFISHSYGLHLDKWTLPKLASISDFKLEGLGFIKVESDLETGNESCERITNPFSSYIVGIWKCPRIDNKERRNRTPYSHFPGFQKVYSNCQTKFKNNDNCFLTCVFHGIITAKYYGYLFLLTLKSGENLQYDETAPFPHLLESPLNKDENLFCFSKDFRSTLINYIGQCNLLSSTEFCIIDEEALYCDPNLENCDFEEREASVMTSGNYAHLVTCGTLDIIKWKFFDNSSKMLCILPGKRKLQATHRKVFKDCHLCSSKDSRKNEAVIEFHDVPTKEELSKVVYSGRPIIIRNATSTEGIPPFNTAMLKEIYQDFLVGDWKPCKLQVYSETSELSNIFLSMIKQDGLYYLRWSVCHPEIRKRFGSIIKTRPSFLPDDYPRTIGYPWVYAAAPGETNGFHVDYFREMTWQAQLSGSKIWRLGPPPECSHICNEPFEVTVNQGDFILVYTSTWYHGVRIEGNDPSLAIGIEYELREEGEMNKKL